MTEPHYRVAFELARERSKQIIHNEWNAEHDDTHSNGELATAAACYALAMTPHSPAIETSPPPPNWPWLAVWWQPRSRRHALVRAGALIIAEIERLDRKEARHHAAAIAAEEAKSDDA